MHTLIGFLKQFMRDWLVKEGLKGREDVEMPEAIVNETASKYREAFEKLSGQKWNDALEQGA